MRIGLWIVLGAMLTADGAQPARLTESPVRIALPPVCVQCQAAFDVGVDPSGLVTEMSCLYGSAPLTNGLEEVVAHWCFEPATEDGVPKPSHVLVAALFRPPALFNVGPCGPPDAMILAPPDLPVPIVVRPPTYPVHALGRGVVIVEVDIGPSGDVGSARALGGPTAFDGAAEQAAQAWRFLPGCRQGRPVPTVAYLVFGFQEPALSAGRD